MLNRRVVLVLLSLFSLAAQTSFALVERTEVEGRLRAIELEASREFFRARFGTNLEVRDSLGSEALDKFADGLVTSEADRERIADGLKREDPMIAHELAERFRHRLEESGLFSVNADGTINTSKFDAAAKGVKDARILAPLRSGLEKYSPKVQNVGSATVRATKDYFAAVSGFSAKAGKVGQPTVSPAEAELDAASRDWLGHVTETQHLDKITDILNTTRKQRDQLLEVGTPEARAEAEKMTNDVRAQVESILLRSDDTTRMTELDALQSKLEKHNVRLIGGSEEMVTAGDQLYRKKFLEAEFKAEVKARNPKATEAEMNATLSKMGSLELEAAVKGFKGKEFAALKAKALEEAAEADLLHLLRKVRNGETDRKVIEALFESDDGNGHSCTRARVLKLCQKKCLDPSFLKIAASGLGMAAIGGATANAGEAKAKPADEAETKSLLDQLYKSSKMWMDKERVYQDQVAQELHTGEKKATGSTTTAPPASREPVNP